MHEAVTHTNPTEKPTKNRQEGHSMLTTKAVDICGVPGQVGREIVSPFKYIVR